MISCCRNMCTASVNAAIDVELNYYYFIIIV